MAENMIHFYLQQSAQDDLKIIAAIMAEDQVPGVITDKGKLIVSVAVRKLIADFKAEILTDDWQKYRAELEQKGVIEPEPEYV